MSCAACMTSGFSPRSITRCQSTCSRPFRHLGYGPGDFPVAEAAAEQLLSLPLYPEITREQQARVADAVRRALRG